MRTSRLRDPPGLRPRTRRCPVVVAGGAKTGARQTYGNSRGSRWTADRAQSTVTPRVARTTAKTSDHMPTRGEIMSEERQAAPNPPPTGRRQALLTFNFSGAGGTMVFPPFPGWPGRR